MKENKTNLLAITISFAATCFTFFLYFRKFLKENKQVSNQINQLTKDLNIVDGRAPFFLYIVYFICLVFFLMLGFLIYKIIFKIVKVKINDVKLLLAVETAYAVTFLIGYIAIGHMPYIITILLCNLIEMAMVLFMCIDEVLPKLLKVILCRSFLVIISLMGGLLS